VEIDEQDGGIGVADTEVDDDEVEPRSRLGSELPPDADARDDRPGRPRAERLQAFEEMRAQRRSPADQERLDHDCRLPCAKRWRFMPL
jgi:hypothetical protein